ncbi:MAG: HD-GYP domain-containing protein [Candidatus Fermentithermobacillus carboniphilus]|uniref:HD-GYP domain-containing protein n=1 Tax=Candidatus Fermentithermobacillus carboniphilus TaxID=3085328 RepID=A0AAT9LBM5_9FIRM|nr:MAG: HD-GYP domain-containing protein [Candidatus Fermentithermobacillus carboniphilus]
MTRKSKLTDLYIWAVALTGLLVLFTNIPDFQNPRKTLDMVVLAFLVALGEMASVPFVRGRGTVSVSTPVIYTAGVLYGPAAGIWISSLATLRKKDLQLKVPLPIVLFNRGMLAICMELFAMTYRLMGGQFGGLSFPEGVVPFLVAASVYTLANAVLTSVAVSLQLQISLASVWKSNVIWLLPNLFALFPLGALMVLVAQQAGPLVLLLFYMPLLVTKYSLEKYIELRDVYNEMAAALSTAIDARDSYTHGHSERVAEYAALLAKELKLPDEQVEMIRYVALLHDVGKVGIRDSILKKQGSFTYDEYEEMKKHAEIGADILKVMKSLAKGQDWVRYHHERWDGTGFPKKLRGEEIPLGARIIACADSFDAMTTDRPYKEKMSFEEAKKELLRCSGSQFDPKVVEAMIRVIDKHILRK